MREEYHSERDTQERMQDKREPESCLCIHLWLVLLVGHRLLLRERCIEGTFILWAENRGQGAF